MVNPIVLSIPIFFILIAIEIFIGRFRKQPLYRFNDAATNISCGITQQISGVFLKTAIYAGYFFIFQNYRLFDIPNTWVWWVILFLGIDFCYYWFHRYAHEISFFWGTHIVHHQSEEYNLSVALRQSTFQAFVSNIFYLPLALIGFNPFSFLFINAFQTLYQFWIHTKTIGKLHPWFEFLFNTPSHHRVHHGINPEYIDKNHGGTLILFDRMFGTFQEEKEAVVYGVTRPLASWNPIWANFDYYYQLFGAIIRTPGLKNKVNYLIKKPGWQPEFLGGPITAQPITPEEQKKYDTNIPPMLSSYIFFQYFVLLLGTSLFLFFLPGESGGGFVPWMVKLSSILIFSSVLSLGGLFEMKKWAIIMEFFRLLAIPVSIIFITYTRDPYYLITSSLILFLIISIPWLLRALSDRPAANTIVTQLGE